MTRARPRLLLSTVACATVLTLTGTASAQPAPGADPAGGGGAVATPRPGAAGVGDSYWPLDGNGGIDVRHYDIRNRYRFATGELSGATTITLRATQDLSRFRLDFLLPVTDVTVDGVAAEQARPHPHELVVVPQVPLLRGQEVDVRVTYAGFPDRYSYAGEGNWLADRGEVVAMNQPHMAPWWFPANDHPRDKATYDVRIMGPRGHQVVSNGLPVGRTVSGASATTHWRTTDPMASYLAFFALGRFQVARGRRNGLPYYLAVSRRLPDDARSTAMRLLRRTSAITAFLAHRVGRYPFESTGGLVTSLPIGFALENQTRPTYPEVSESDTYLLVHELAHQWFGDSVSVRRWRDIWLNEGFATFFEAVHADVAGGPSARSWLHNSYGARRDDAQFWRLDITNPGPNHIFDDEVYYRGAMATQALRGRVGERAFWRILRTWVRERHDGVGTSPAFEALAERVSGQQLDGFFDAWLRAPRPPARTRANGLR